MPVKREKKIMTTWVEKLSTGDVSPYLSLSVFIYVCICVYACLTCCFTSAEVLRIVQENGGKATATSLSMLMHRALTVPLTIHPTTSTKKRSTQINTTNVCFRVQIFSKDRTYSLGGTMELAQGRQFRG